MKTLASVSAVAALLALAACGPGTPATKPVQKNTAPPAAGTMKSPTEELKERMSSADAASGAAAAAGTGKK